MAHFYFTDILLRKIDVYTISKVHAYTFKKSLHNNILPQNGTNLISTHYTSGVYTFPFEAKKS